METNLLMGTDINHEFLGFEKIYDFSCCLAKVQALGKYGFVGFDCEYVVEPMFDEVKCFSEGFAVVKLNGKYGFVNKDGKYLVKPLFDDAECFSDGLAKVCVNGNVRYLKKNGKFQSRIEKFILKHFSKKSPFLRRLFLYPQWFLRYFNLFSFILL